MDYQLTVSSNRLFKSTAETGYVVPSAKLHGYGVAENKDIPGLASIPKAHPKHVLTKHFSESILFNKLLRTPTGFVSEAAAVRLVTQPFYFFLRGWLQPDHLSTSQPIVYERAG